MSGKILPILLAGICLTITGCKTYDTTLEYVVIDSPIQFGPHHTQAQLDTLGLVSGFMEVEIQEETYAETEHSYIGMEGDEYYEDTIDSTIFQPLYDNPRHFIADGEVQVEVEYGIRFGSFLFGTLAALINNGEPSYGDFTRKKFHQTGVVYKYKNQQQDDDNDE